MRAFSALTLAVALSAGAFAEVVGTYKGTVSANPTDLRAFITKMMSQGGNKPTAAQVDGAVKQAMASMSAGKVDFTFKKGGKGTVTSKGPDGKSKSDAVGWKLSGDIITITTKGKPIQGRVSKDHKTIVISEAENRGAMGGAPVKLILKKA